MYRPDVVQNDGPGRNIENFRNKITIWKEIIHIPWLLPQNVEKTTANTKWSPGSLMLQTIKICFNLWILYHFSWYLIVLRRRKGSSKKPKLRRCKCITSSNQLRLSGQQRFFSYQSKMKHCTFASIASAPTQYESKTHICNHAWTNVSFLWRKHLFSQD